MRVAVAALLLMFSGCLAEGPSGDGDAAAQDAEGAQPIDDGRTARSDGVVVAGAGSFKTTLESFDYATPSWSIADQSFMNPAPQLRGSPPEALHQTLVEARIAPGPSVGGWSMRVYETTFAVVGQAAPPRCSSGDLGRTDQPDADGVYRVVLAPGTWTCNGLGAIFFSSGQPAGLIVQAHVDVWTTTFEGVEMPAGFTAAT